MFSSPCERAVPKVLPISILGSCTRPPPLVHFPHAVTFVLYVQLRQGAVDAQLVVSHLHSRPGLYTPASVAYAMRGARA